MQGRYEEMLQAHEEAIRLNPDDARSWYGKGNALEHFNRYEEALEAYNTALRIDPNCTPAQQDKSGVLTKLGRREGGTT